MTLNELTQTGQDNLLDVIQIIKTLNSEIIILNEKLKQANDKIKELETISETDGLGGK